MDNHASPPKDATTTPAFKPIRSPRAFEEIAAQIRAELSEGRLKVGSRLPSERALAEQFSVSRNTLREALRSLEHAGLIRLQKGATGGAFISQASGEVITTGLLDMFHVGAIRPAQLTEARIWLESIIVREACLRATPEDLERLRENVKLAERAAASGDFLERAEVNMDFHRILARMTGNPVMVIVMDGLLEVLRHFVQSIGEFDNSFVPPSRKRVIRLMEKGDAEGAVAEMEASLKRLQRNYLSMAKESGVVSGGESASDSALAARASSASRASPAPSAAGPARRRVPKAS
ncbi:DNA-binding transcriptional regulator, FadR family [Variovorax sp. HW608]|uniref:FadR/GntR family transcriptional regulator n=1 Tax=Variovorax sp. HW608 TaxID=1034889 RepID=UPI0008201A0B|nr:FadR/GntR family transcriptional regulator [Variovorax sp. HW608]SCK30328.1 DNA-binding transcriptional regulator, FadR family [Variovorax sp. HW608]